MIFDRTLIAEGLGSFFLCLAWSLGRPEAGAAVYVLLATSLGAAGHPALTVAAYLGNQITQRQGLRNLAAQGVGAVAAVVMGFIWHESAAPLASYTVIDFCRCLAGEMLAALLIGLVFLRSSGPQHVWLVGLALLASALVFAGATGNPATLLTAALLGKGSFFHLLASLLGATAGMLGAAFLAQWWSKATRDPANDVTSN